MLTLVPLTKPAKARKAKPGEVTPAIAEAAERYRAVFNAVHHRRVSMPPEAVETFAARAAKHATETLIALPLLAVAQGMEPQEIDVYLRDGSTGTFAWVPKLIARADATTLSREQADLARQAGVLEHLTGKLRCKVRAVEPENWEP